MFYTPPEVPRGISRGHNPATQSRNSTTAAQKSAHRNSRATNPSNSNARGDGHDWSDWPSGGWDHYSEEDWKVAHQKIEEKEEMAETVECNRETTDDAFSERGNSQQSFSPNAPRGISPESTPKSPAIASTPKSHVVIEEKSNPDPFQAKPKSPVDEVLETEPFRAIQKGAFPKAKSSESKSHAKAPAPKSPTLAPAKAPEEKKIPVRP